jgi:PAS domain S-box-containing protein
MKPKLDTKSITLKIPLAIRNRFILPFLVLLTFLAITLIIWNISYKNSRKDLWSYLEYRINEHAAQIEKRLMNYEFVLKSLRGLYNISDNVNRPKFHSFFNSLNLEESYPGIQGVGFSLIIQPEQVKTIINSIRAEGFPEYKIWPEGKRETYTSIIYLEPFKDLNLRAFGYDMFSEPVRRKAMEAARDSNKAIKSGKVLLVQETGKKVQAGFLIYLPVYKNGKPHTTISDRRKNIIGWVYSPFRMDDFMSGLLGYRAHDLDLKIYDGENFSDKTKMYDSKTDAIKTNNAFALRKYIDFNEHRWIIIEKSTPDLESRLGTDFSRIILIVGLSLSLLLAFITYLLVIKKRQTFITDTESKGIIEKKIASELRYRRLFESAKDGILILNAQTGKIVDVNPFLIELLGYSKEEFLEREIWEIGTFKNIVANKDKFLELQQKKYVRYEDLPLESSDGRKINVEFVSNVYSVNSHMVIQCNIRDITVKRQQELKIDSLTRIYIVLSAINKILLRVRNLDDLFKETCEISVSKGNYNMAWIGLIDKKKNSVIPVAWNGEAEEYLKGVTISLENLPENLGTAGRAIIEKQNIVNNNIEENNILFSRSAKALKMNFHSVASFPLRYNGEVDAVISFYSNKENHFNNEEILLLQELADDVSFSMYTIRQEELRRQVELEHNKLSVAVEQSPASVIITSPDGDIEYVNTKFCEVTGYTKNEAIGKNPSFLKSGYQDNKFYEELWDTVLSGKEWKGELQNKKKNGDLFWETSQISPLVNENGDITNFIAVKEDTTDQRKTKAELLDIQERYKSIFNNSVELIYIFDLQGNIFEVNKKTLTLFGYTAEEAKCLNISDILNPADLSIAKKNIEYIVENGANKGLQTYRFVTKGGKEIFVETTGIRMDKDGKPFGIMGIARDITLQKQAQDELNESEKRYRELFEKMLDGVYKSSHEGKFLQVNNALVKMLGYNSKEELYDLDIKTQLYFQESDRESAALEEKREEMAIFRLKRKDGSGIWVEDHGRHILDDKGNVLYHEGVMRDVTERLKMEEELIKAKEYAEEMNRIKNNFLANMSHELRTPLIGILGYAEFLMGELKDKELIEMADIILKSGKRLNLTLNNLLDISKIEAEKEVTNIKKQNILKFINEQVKLFVPVAEAKNLVLKLDARARTLNADIDEGLFISIINNLINNAVKYTDQGEITVIAMQKDNNAVIEVNDTGIGVPVELQEIIFDPFRQASEGLNRKYEGTGLGLTLAKKYATLLGGQLTLKSIPGAGSTFTLILPLADAADSDLLNTTRG